MDSSIGLIVAGVIVGFTVGLTGMGGGALMTPILVLFFGIQPLAAVSSDLVASFFMKPVGGTVHLRHGSVNLKLAGWLCVGSVPAAFAGVLLLRAMGDGVQDTLTLLLGVALLLAATSIMVKSALGRRRALVEEPADARTITVHRVPVVLIGILGGLVVGMTSVGSGSLMIVLLLILYPRLTASSLVGTDLVQAVPLVGAAALGHFLFGDFQLDVAGWLIVGAIPAVYVGARLSAVAPDNLLRPVLVVVLAASGLKFLQTPNWVIGVFLVGSGAVALGRVVMSRIASRPLAEAVEVAGGP